MSLVNQELLDHVVSLCRDAGSAILEVYKRESSIEINIKDDNSPVTEADIAAHKILVSGLSALNPNIPIISEESEIPSFEVRSQWGCYWLIDPLDGTKEFIHRNGEFTVNVALIENGVPILGVVYAPVLNVVYTGAQDLGAAKISENGHEAIRVRALAGRDTSSIPVSIVASRRHGAEALSSVIQKIEAHFGAVTSANMGSSLKLCLVAEGLADIYPRLAPTCEWDTAAAHAVVDAAGGQVVADDLTTLRYNTKDSMLNPFFFVLGDANVPWPSLLLPEAT